MLHLDGHLLIEISDARNHKHKMLQRFILCRFFKQIKYGTAVSLYCTFVNTKYRDTPMSAHVTSPSFSLSMLTHPTALKSVVEPRPLLMIAAKLFCSARPLSSYGTGEIWQSLLVHLPAISTGVSQLVNCQ